MSRLTSIPNWLVKLILISLVFKLILAPFFFHPDLKIIYYISHFLPKGVVNIWEFLENNPDKNILGQFVYPPFTYLTFGIFYSIIKPLAGGAFDLWLGMGNTATDINNILRFQFLTKLPLIVFESLAAFVVYKLFKLEERAKLAVLLWLFNPFTLYSTTIMGQFDTLPAIFSLTSIYLIKNNKFVASAIALGLAASLKTYALLLLPLLAITGSSDLKTKAKIFLVGLSTYFVTVLPFISSEPFRKSVLFSDLGQRIFSASIEFGFDDGVLIAPVIIVFIYLYAWYKKLHSDSLVFLFAATILAILSLSHIHPQWFTWAAPFLVILYIQRPNLKPVFILLTVTFISYILLYPDIFLNIGLLSPLNHGIFFLNPLTSHIEKIYSPDSLRYIIHTVILATSAFIVYAIARNKNTDEHQ